MSSHTGVAADFIYWDASRVASKEVLLVHAWLNGKFVSAPLQILPDQPSVHAPDQALENIAHVILPIAKKQRLQRPRRREGEATQSLLYAVSQVVKVIIPVKDLTIWKPTYLALPGNRQIRKWCPIDQQFFYWNMDTKESLWCPPPELRVGRDDDLRLRILTIVADEGSTGWGLHQWLALKEGFRVFWHRDPLHRLSSLFTNSLKSTSGVLNVVFNHLLIHRWRRAPWGSGKFWKEQKETMELFIENCKHTHPIFEHMMQGIATDHGVEGAPAEQVWQLLQQFKHEPMGPKVQMRRWFTIWDAGWGVDRLWHTMLFALVMSYALDGTDAFHLAGQVVPRVQKGDTKQEQNFKFKQQVLVILLDQGHQRILRSMLHIFERLRMHQVDFTKDCSEPASCLKYHLLWSNSERWTREMILPTLLDSLCSLNVMDRLLFKGVVSDVASPFILPLEMDYDDAGVLLHHLRLTMDAAWQMVVYSAQVTSPPWCYCLLLDPDESVRASCLHRLRAIWKLVIKLESSAQPDHRRHLHNMPLVKWVVFREPMLLLEAGSWSLDSPHGKLAVLYIEALWSGNTHTLALENGFNDLRDNEGRGARHKSRSDPVLQGLALSSMAARYSACTPLVEVEPADIAGQKRMHMRNESFQASRAPTTVGSLGVDASSIVDDRKSWASTSPHEFSTNQIGLMNALHNSKPSTWGNLWMSVLLRGHMVISNHEANQAWYVLGSRQHSVALLKLKLKPGDNDRLLWTIEPDMSSVEYYVPVVALDQYRCHSHTVSLGFRKSNSQVNIQLDNIGGDSMVQFCCKNFLHRLLVRDLRALAAAIGVVDMPKLATHMTYVEKILAHEEIGAVHVELILGLLRSKLEKRSRKARKQTDDADDSKDEPIDVEDEDDQEDVVAGNPFARSLPESEVAFAMGSLPAGMALHEEEDDEGLDELAKMALDTAAASTPPPLPARPRASASASSSSSNGPKASSSSPSGPSASSSSSSGPSASSSSSHGPLVSVGLPVSFSPPAANQELPGIMEASVASEPDMVTRAHRLEAARVPSLEHAVAPKRCSLALYPGKDGNGLRWQAKIPKGEPAFEGTMSKSVSFRIDEDGLAAKLVCYTYLQRWAAQRAATT